MSSSTVQDIEKVSIRPGVGVLSVISHIRYKSWYALAEFVDNAIQSFLTYKTELERLHGKNLKLRVEIEVDSASGGQIVIRDNAAGIHAGEYQRAFRPAALPDKRTGLSEFGMGMKTAACWFANRWTVRTKALGEAVERTVRFNIDEIVRDSIEELDIQSLPSNEMYHYTEITLESLNHTLPPRTLNKVRDHLASIYRVFLREGVLELTVGGQQLAYEEFKVLEAPFHSRPNKPDDLGPRRWYKDIDFDFGRSLRVHGFAAIREKASTTHAGFALFRHNRVIQGSGDETYRPSNIFKNANSFTYQRLSGELHLEGFEVSHTKDGFRWDDQEEPFLDLLKEYLDSSDLPLLQQAENYRVRAKPEDIKKTAINTTERVAEVVEREAPPVIERQLVRAPVEETPEFESATEAPVATREIDIKLKDKLWRVRLEQSCDPSIGDWLSVLHDSESYVDSPEGQRRFVVVRISLAHPFMMQFGGVKALHLEPIFRIAVAIALSEVAARGSGVKQAGEVRRNINELLREALWK